ncbi:MAG TPA: glutathione S-transferase family protein [Verrucomicrobiae bacterium]|nr:glutathione S-transferase family protein [Verrucomicrobiae bacterium]
MTRAVLHQWEMSPFCNKVRRCLHYKGVAFETVDYNGLLARKAASLSPAGQLPVLDCDGERIADSAAIAQFLDRRWPDKPLYPTQAVALAEARIWDDWASKSLYFFQIYFRMLDPVSRERALDLICKGRPGWERVVLSAVFKRRYPRKLAAQGLARQPLAEVERQFFEMLGALDTVLAQRRFLARDALSIADIGVSAQVSELLRTSDLAPKVLALPHLKAFLSRCDELAPA